MKPKIKPILWGLAIVAGLASLTAEPNSSNRANSAKSSVKGEDHTGPRHVRVQVEYIEMSLETMAALLDDEKATVSDVILRDHVAQLIKADKARIIETQLLICRSDEKTTCESIREFIYPAEYESSKIAKVIQTSKNGTKTEVHDDNLATGPTPTSFETRNLGSTLEIEPQISENYPFIDLRFTPEIIYHTKNNTYATWKDKRGTADVAMPEFYVLRFNTAITVPSGKSVFVSALSPKNEQGHVDYTRKLMVFVKATIINVQ